MIDAAKYFFEKVYVETPVDTDGDGKYDLIAVYIKRPLETAQKVKVPCIYVADPYMMGCNENWYQLHDINQKVKVYPQQEITVADVTYDFDQKPTYNIKELRVTAGYALTAPAAENFQLEAISDLYDYFLTEGYAAVFCAGLGTLGSEGITKTGSREEVAAFKAVIDWLNGRARAFTDKEKNIEIKAWWSTGKVAMSAKSYLGTMCIAVASTGVAGLETIIPEAAISNWYNYYKCNGLNVPALGWQGDDIDLLAKYCFSRAKDEQDFKKVKTEFLCSQAELERGEDRDSGNYNRFWDERNYLRQMDQFKASVLIIHGLNDWNVKTNQCYPFFKELEKRSIPRKIILHQGPHIYIYHLKGIDILNILKRWLDHYLKGIDNGIEKEPKVLIQSNLDQSKWEESESWAPANQHSQLLTVESKGPVTIIDDLSKTSYQREKDNQADWLNELVLTQKSSYQNRIKYIWSLDKMNLGTSKVFRFSGEAKISFTAAIDQPTAILSAMLVDIGTDYRLTEETQEDEQGEFTFKRETSPSSFKVITRGWLNAQNRRSLYCKDEIDAGKYYQYSFSFMPTDYLLKRDHKLALIIYGIDAEATQRPQTITRITIKQETIKLMCPLKG